MEEDLSLVEQIRRKFGRGEVDIRTYSPLTLAFIGDGIYDAVIRTAVVGRGNRGVNGVHRTVVRYVNAGTQAALIQSLLDELSEEELAVYKRGRNAKSYTKAKNASFAEYHQATGMEALIGYLYLQDRMDRILDLIYIGLHKIEMGL